MTIVYNWVTLSLEPTPAQANQLKWTAAYCYNLWNTLLLDETLSRARFNGMVGVYDDLRTLPSVPRRSLQEYLDGIDSNDAILELSAVAFVYHEFQQATEQVITLAAPLPEFRNYLDTQSAFRLPSSLVTIREGFIDLGSITAMKCGTPEHFTLNPHSDVIAYQYKGLGKWFIVASLSETAPTVYDPDHYGSSATFYSILKDGRQPEDSDDSDL